MNSELLKEAKKCKTIDELEELAKANNLKFSTLELKTFLNNKQEMNDDELNNVNGGITRICNSGDIPEFKKGQRVKLDSDTQIYKIINISGSKAINYYGSFQYRYEIIKADDNELNPSYSGWFFEYELEKE